MEQFGFVCVMSSEQTAATTAAAADITSSSSSSCSNSQLQLEDAIAVIRDIAAEEGKTGYLPSEEAFVPADLMASEEDNDNASQDYTSTGQVADTSYQDYLPKPEELNTTQPGTSQQLIAPCWLSDPVPPVDCRYYSPLTYPVSPQPSNYTPYSYYGRSASLSPSLMAAGCTAPASPSYKLQRSVISPYAVNRLNVRSTDYMFNFPKISRKSRRNFMFSSCEYSHVKKLYIWDLNGVLIPHIDQIDNSSPAVEESQQPGRVRDMIVKALRVISENSFFQKDLETASLTTIDDHSMDDSGQDLSSYDFTSDGFTTACGMARKKSDMSSKEWNRKLALRCRRIKDVYTRHSASLTELLQSLDGDEDWSNLTTGIDSVTDHWPAKVISCLSLIQSRQDSSSIIISKEPLISMVSKTVVFGLAPYTPITSHYSTTKLGVDKCLKQITDRYGAGCTFIILSNNPERIELAVKNNNYASWPLSNVSDLSSLQTMLQLGHL